MAVNNHHTLPERRLPLRNPLIPVLILVVGMVVLMSDSLVLDYVLSSVTSLGMSVGLVTLKGASEDMGSTLGASEHAESDSIEDEQMKLITSITEACLPKLVCELYAREGLAVLTDGEKSLMSLIGVTSLSSSGPSKYHFAAHMGQLIRGLEGAQGCHQFYPTCPFSGEDVRAIAKKINMR